MRIAQGYSKRNPASDLYQIALYNDPEAWAVLIVQCDQTMMFLNKIDWNKPGETQSLLRSDLPYLGEICEVLPP
jgi:hypothetical protein